MFKIYYSYLQNLNILLTSKSTNYVVINRKVSCIIQKLSCNTLSFSLNEKFILLDLPLNIKEFGLNYFYSYKNKLGRRCNHY